MNSPDPVPPSPPENIPWYKSHVLRGIAVSVFAQILNRFHFTAQFAPDASQIVDTILDLISLASAGYAAYARAHKPLPNLTTTQKKADAANAAATVEKPATPPQSGES